MSLEKGRRLRCCRAALAASDSGSGARAAAGTRGAVAAYGVAVAGHWRRGSSGTERLQTRGVAEAARRAASESAAATTQTSVVTWTRLRRVP